MKNTTSHAFRGVFCAAFGGILWGFSGTCGQYLFTNFEIDALWLTTVRMLSAGVLLSILSFVRSPKSMVGIWRSPWDIGQLILYAVFGLAMCQFSYMTSISYSNAATTTVLQSLGPVLVMLLVCLRCRRLPNRREGVALALAIFGTWLLATGGKPSQMTLSSQGLFWGLLTAVAVASYTLLPARLLPKWGNQVVTGCGMLLGGILVAFGARAWRFSVDLPWQGWLAVAAICLLGTVLSFSLFMQGVSDIGAVKSSVLSATEPVAATIFSALWLGTQFSATDLVGFVCITATVFLLAKSQ